MRVAHIIMAHKNPDQLLRMITKLDHPGFDFYVHIDNKILLDSFKAIFELANVRPIKKRINCNWGGNSLLTAVTSALNEVLSTGINYDFVNLLSAQDYPLHSSAHIYNYFEKAKGKNFISFDISADTTWWKEATSRYEKYHFTDINIKWKYGLQKIVNSVMPSRKFPMYSELYGSSDSTWWTISYECARLVADQLSHNKKLLNFIKYAWGTDEFVVATIIMNSDFRDSVINNNLRYIDWSEGNPHPKLLGIDDFEKIKSSEMLFARKFDALFDEEILDRIDKSQI